MFKKFSTYIVEKIHKMGCLEGSGVPVLYIGHTVNAWIWNILSICNNMFINNTVQVLCQFNQQNISLSSRIYITGRWRCAQC
jgi:hypothetical protein